MRSRATRYGRVGVKRDAWLVDEPARTNGPEYSAELHAKNPDTCSLACLTTNIQVLGLFLACATPQWTLLVLNLLRAREKPQRMLGVFTHRPCRGEQTGAQARLALRNRLPENKHTSTEKFIQLKKKLRLLLWSYIWEDHVRSQAT